jgi:hypothetical protein
VGGRVQVVKNPEASGITRRPCLVCDPHAAYQAHLFFD